MAKRLAFMSEAFAEAEKGIKARDGGPFGAVAVRDGKIIGRGHNTVVAGNDPTAHGEVMAIRDACKNVGSFDLSGAALYTTCYPCPMCLGAILWARIEKVYYCAAGADAAAAGFDDSFFYDFLNDPEKIKELTVRDDADILRSKKLFERYAADKEKKLY